MYACDKAVGWGSSGGNGFVLPTSLPWELGKSLIKQEPAAKPQKCWVGRGGAEKLLAVGGPGVASPFHAHAGCLQASLPSPLHT